MDRSLRQLCVAGSLVFTTCLGSASTAFAQTPPIAPPVSPAIGTQKSLIFPAPTPPAPGLSRLFRDTVTDFRRLPSNETLVWLSFGAAAAAFSHSFDPAVTRSISGAPAPASAFVPGRILGGAGFQFGSSLATYTIGRATGNKRVADVGGRLLRAQLLSQTVTHALKQSFGRTRPDGTKLSFPSGHTSVSFSSATVLQREFGWKVGIPAYAVASYIGLSRIEHRRHYLSDVIFGAAIGIVAGRSVTVGRGDKRFAVTPVAAPGGGGVSFVWVGRR